MQCQAVALSHKNKTVGRPPDWLEETDSNAEWEQWACNEVIWEEMINSSSNARNTYSKEVTLDAEKASKEDTLDAVSKIGEETQRVEDDSMNEISKITATTLLADPSHKILKRLHGERSEVATGQQKSVYTIVYAEDEACLKFGRISVVKLLSTSYNRDRMGSLGYSWPEEERLHLEKPIMLLLRGS